MTIPGVKEDLEKEIQEALSFFEMHMWAKNHPRLGFKPFPLIGSSNQYFALNSSWFIMIPDYWTLNKTFEIFTGY